VLDQGESRLAIAIEVCDAEAAARLRLTGHERVKLLKLLAENTGLTISYGGNHTIANVVYQIYTSEGKEVTEIVNAVAQRVKQS